MQDQQHDPTLTAPPRGQGQGYDGQMHHGPPPPHWGFHPYGGYGRSLFRPQLVETKPFFLTSEFFGALLAVVAMAIAAASADNFDAPLFWALTSGIVAFYLLSRGIAKSGTKSRAGDPREELMRRAAEKD